MTIESAPEFGIVANVIETDRVFRTGAKAWICGGTGGQGWFRFEWLAMSRGGRPTPKWAPTKRFGNFRAAWIPEHLRDRVGHLTGTRTEMEAKASGLERFANGLRSGEFKEGQALPADLLALM